MNKMKYLSTLPLIFMLSTPGYAAYSDTHIEVETAAVASKFSVPDVNYDTPAFKAGKQDFTLHKEMMDYVYGIQKNSSNIQIRNIGYSQEGREIPLLVFSKSNTVDGERLIKSQRPTVFIIGQQHGNEPAGGEAALVLAKRLAEGDLNYLLERINVLVVPRANPDGAEEFNRVTISGVDVNRDHLLLNSPEAQAIAKVTREYMPDIVVDSHEFTALGRWVKKFGLVQSQDALIQYATNANVPAKLTEAADALFRAPVVEALKEKNFAVSWYYTTSKKNLHDHTISMGGIKPNVGRNVNGLRNSLSFLIEVRGVGIGKAHLKRRVRTSELLLTNMLKQTYKNDKAVLKLTQNVSEEVTAMACKGDIVIDGKRLIEKRDLTFFDAVTGEEKVINADWRSSLKIVPTLTRPRPCGYVIDGSQTVAVERLRKLGVRVSTIKEPTTVKAERYVITESKEGKRKDARGSIDDKKSVLKLKVDTKRDEITVPEGALYVSMAQPLANIIAAAMEPDEENGYVANRLLELEEGVGLLRITETPKTTLVIEDSK